MSNTTAPTGPTGSNEKRLPAALVPFLLGLHELAGVSDAIVELVGRKPEMDTLRALGDRASELQNWVQFGLAFDEIDDRVGDTG